MVLRAFIGSRFLDRLVRTRRGRALLLSFLVDAEEADEKGVFDNLLSRVDDPELQKLVRVHYDDETRHGHLMRQCLDRGGLSYQSVPELRIVPWVDHYLGEVADRFIAKSYGVMEAYLFLQVLEERAVLQYPLFARALQPVDPDSAAVITRIVEDEKRHVKYARAISRRYAPDPTTLEQTLARYREAEACAFVENGRALVRHAVEHDLLETRAPERWLWTALVKLNTLAGRIRSWGS